ncbi:MAG TPA: hypothetical protein PKC96_01535 [Bacilli bacterium]|nr:hypothetical protein [Bacilli bacterium]
MREHINDSPSCDTGSIDLTALTECFKQVIKEIFDNRKDIIEELTDIVGKVVKTNNVDIKIASLKEQKAILVSKMSSLLDMKLNSKSVDETKLYDEKYQSQVDDLGKINRELDKYADLDISEVTSKSRLELVKEKHKEYENGNLELTGALLLSFINKILAIDNAHIIYLVPNKKELSTPEIKAKRKELIKKLKIHSSFYERKLNTKTYKLNYKIILI